jgi:hypothetical protein
MNHLIYKTFITFISGINGFSIFSLQLSNKYKYKNYKYPINTYPSSPVAQIIPVNFVPMAIHRIPINDSLAVAISGSDGRIHTYRADSEARELTFDEVLCGLILPEVDKVFKSESVLLLLCFFFAFFTFLYLYLSILISSSNSLNLGSQDS